MKQERGQNFIKTKQEEKEDFELLRQHVFKSGFGGLYFELSLESLQ